MTAGNSAGGPLRPVTLLIAALGGEGGGVLTDWIVRAAMAEGFPVQSTSIPGVAQRTGATTYYIEILPVKTADLAGRTPVLALYPAPGNIDVMVASELLEAGRAMELGFVSPERTTLIASTHRIYSIAEKSAMADGIYDGARVRKAAPELAKRPVLFDFQALARNTGSVINAVLLGAIAGLDQLPISAAALEQAIRDTGIAVESNLAGFSAGAACVRGEAAAPAAPAEPERSWARRRLSVKELLGIVESAFPPEAHAVLQEGIRRLADYQGPRYARLYLERLGDVLAADREAGAAGSGFALTRETARHLALWMSYEDVIRVAELKSRRARFDRVRTEVAAKPDEPVQITEFLKPGVEEVAALLPPGLGRRLLAWADRKGLRDRLHLPLRIRSDTVLGFLRLWLLAHMKWWRRFSHRFAEEQALIERWRAALTAMAREDYELALEIAACAKLLKGYGETHRRGRGNFLRIFEARIAPALAGAREAGAAETLRQAREAALADPEGAALNALMPEPGTASGAGVEARAAAE
ncbi:MAG: indolepyruvate oxidoreductase subunit beta family protein [Alphaproteobacteria bacterium]|nr:indolepyruvate oxidoreductase subunit beta family protein [Alphaproteobacteria bacterium]